MRVVFRDRVTVDGRAYVPGVPVALPDPLPDAFLELLKRGTIYVCHAHLERAVAPPGRPATDTTGGRGTERAALISR